MEEKWMLTAEQCRVLASEFKSKSQAPNTSRDRAFVMNNIARSLMGLATQLDTLAIKIKEEARRGGN